MLGLGFIGCGSVLDAYLAVAARLERRGLSEARAACGRERQRSRVLEELGVPAFHTDAAELLARSDVDVVVVLTPMPSHAALAAAALRAGKHVVLEKPLGVNLEEARELVELARRGPPWLVCAPFTTLSPTFLEIGRRIARGEIGRVISARGRYGWAGPDWADWFYRPGGGALFDLGVYNLTTLTGWLGPVRRVTAMAGVAIPQRWIGGRAVRVEADDNAHVLLDFGEACFAAVTCGFTLQQYRGPAIELYGTDGVIQLLGDDWDPDGFELWQNRAGCWQLFKETQPDWPWADGLQHLVECVAADRAPTLSLQHALHVLEVMIRAQEAARDGCARELQTTFTPLEFAEATTSVAAHRVHDRTRSE